LETNKLQPQIYGFTTNYKAMWVKRYVILDEIQQEALPVYSIFSMIIFENPVPDRITFPGSASP
jgi:hypothetical protein